AQSTVTAVARRSHAEVRTRRARVLDQYSGSPIPRYTNGVVSPIEAIAVTGNELEPYAIATSTCRSRRRSSRSPRGSKRVPGSESIGSESGRPEAHTAR